MAAQAAKNTTTTTPIVMAFAGDPVGGGLVREPRPAGLVAFALTNHLPLVSGTSRWTASGALMDYGPSLPDASRRAAAYVDKILKGARPADLPV